MIDKKVLHIVHCIDTEGPLNETIDATFDRLESIFKIKITPSKENLILLQERKIDLSGQEEAVAKCFSPELLNYNSDWSELELMLDELLSESFRNELLDDFGNGWVYSWHCMDHMSYLNNPRHKDVGYGNILRFYKSKLKNMKCMQDELNWHFHPLSLTRNPMQSATSYANSYDVLLQILCRRILEDNFFPSVNRPGFHSERPDSHAFLEQWIPFDYANQSIDEVHHQPDLLQGRFGDWSRAPKTWKGYHPSHDDYQEEGLCRRLIFRCLNVGTRFNSLTPNHAREAFSEAQVSGSAILSFADHDYRDMRPDVIEVRNMINEIKKEFPDVLVKYSGAEEAAISLMNYVDKPKPKLSLNLIGNRIIVEVTEGEIFGPQPFLSIKTKEGNFYHDNFDTLEPKKRWTYVLDSQTLEVSSIESIGVGTAGRYGGTYVVKIDL